jgi:predicted Zn-dependent peptidase
MIDSYTLDAVRGFYDDNFGAGRARIYVSGRFDPRAMRSAIETAFGDWKEGAPATIDIPEPVSGRAVYLMDRPGAPQSTINLGIPTADPSSDDYIAVQVMNAMLGGAGFLARITKNIREDKGYTYSPFSQVSVRYRDGYWMQSADVSTDVTGAALDEIFYEVERMRDEPPSEEELEGIQNYLGGIFVLQNSSRGGVAGQLSYVDMHGLGDDYLDTYVEKIHAVTPEEVQRMAQKYLNPDDMLLVITGDQEVIADQLEKFGTPELVAEE